jgi:ribonuclease HI
MFRTNKLDYDEETSQAISTHKQNVKNYFALRKQHLQNLIDDLNDRSETNKSNSIKSLMQREEKRQDFKKIRRVFKAGKGKGITTLEIPDPENPGQWKTITIPTECKSKLIVRNIGHFGQSKDTPFATSPLNNLLGYKGTSIIATSLIFNKTKHPDFNNLPDHVKDIINKLGDGQRIQPIPEIITVDEFCSGFRVWNERTTTSPSNRHLGLYKLLLRLPILDKDDNETNLSLKIMHLHYKISMSCAKMGRPLNRWCNVSTIMIQKDKNSTKITRLRVIHLYEADYNLLLKIVWARKGVRNAHNKNALNIGQAGSRPNMKAIDVVINKEMKYLYARLTRTALGTIDNDAKSCFDRIICNLAMMVSLYYGIPLNFCQLQANTLKNTIFRLRTALGDSAQTYRHTIENPIHGTGQGCPALWLLISSLLMDLLERKSNGMKMIDVNNKYEIKKWIEGFVDDTSIITNIDFISQCAQTLVQHLQEDGCEWAGLLEASGGKLELTKCFYYMLTWSWNEKGEPLPQTIQQQNVQNKVTLSNLSGDPVIIQQKEVEQSHKTLGTYKCIDGNETEHIIQLNKKSTNMGNLVFSGQLNRRQARLAHNMVYIPSMLYSLPAMSIPEEETYSIQQKANTKFLQVCGLAKSFPRAVLVVYGPTEFGGIGLKYLYTESSCIKIDCLINHIKTDTSLSIEMKININWVQLHAGTSTPILESTQQLLYIEYNWFLSIKEFLNMINAKIEITNLWQPSPLREGDIILMDKVEKLDISIAKKRSFNCWRLFFRINNLTEMTNSQGTHIQKIFLNKYDLDNYIPSSLLNWPSQPHPHHKYFNNWLRILRALFRIDKNGKLHKPLGKWITGSKIQIPNNVNFLLHKNIQIIGVRDENSHLWSFYHKTNEIRSTLYFDKLDDLEMPPIDPNEYEHIDAEETNDYYKINKRSIKSLTSKQTHEHNNTNQSHIQEHKRSMEKWHSPIFKNTTITNDDAFLNSQEKTIKISTDGGAKDGKGSFGVVMSIEEEIIATNYSRTPQIHNDIHSYRAEGYGILCGLALFQEIQNFCSVHKSTTICQKIQIQSDSKSMVDKINSVHYWKINTKQCNEKDMDIIMEIKRIMEKLQISGTTITMVWVKGHQDRLSSNLSTDAKLNIEADALATYGLRMRNMKSNINLPSSKAIITIHGLQITAKRTSILRNAFQSMQLRQYMKTSNNWTDKQTEQIWWKMHGNALNPFSEGKRMILQKYLHNQLPCNQRNHVMYEFKSQYCTLCPDIEEDQSHMIRCKNCPRREEIRKKLKRDMIQLLVNTNTNSTVTRVLTYSLNAWLNGTKVPELKDLAPDASPTLLKAYNFQKSIGWEQILKGRFDFSWGEMYNYEQQQTINQNQNPNSRTLTAESWGAKIITLLWNFVLDIWFCRNDIEHNLNDAATEIHKRKLKEQILWLNSKINDSVNHPYKNVTEMSLLTLPVNNLLIMVDQLTTIYEKHRINPEAFDVT